MTERVDAVNEALRGREGRLSRVELLAAAEKARKAAEPLDYSFDGGVPSWEEVEELFGVSRAECMADVDAYCSGLEDDYRMTVELYFGELGIPREDFRDVAEGFWKNFPSGAVVDLDSGDAYAVLDTEEKQLWGYALAKAVAGNGEE